MASLALESIRKTFPGGVDVVRDVSFEVADGELVSLVGPSGCGKSTLLNIIAGLESPSSGTVRIGDAVVNDRSPGERDIAMVFQSYALYPHMTVRQNIAFPLDVARVSRDEITKRVNETAARLEIESLLDRKPAQLSGGQRQRVALGRALVRRPKVFLLDEPLSNLDAALRAQMRGELKRLHAALGATFVYVTHDQAEAMTLSDRVVVLSRGAVQQIAPPVEVYTKPANRFVAEFFGTPRINVVAPAVLGLESQPDRLAGVRPEDLRLGGDENRGRVDLVEPMGAETWVTVVLRGERVIARAEPTSAVRRGDEVSLCVDRSRVVWFDAKRGERVASPGLSVPERSR